MDVILIQDVPSLGKAGDQVRVASGYARNYLLPKKLALLATEGNLKQWEVLKGREEKAAEMDKQKAEELKTQIEAISVTLAKQAGEQDKLFGSVTSTEIAGALSLHGIEIDKKRIHIEGSIKRLGEYTVSIKLFTDVTALLPVVVIREE
jgi:large subunit ribosomal protein L9